jgi:hypothetical protein
MVLSGACLSLLGRSGTGKTHLARSITRFFKTMTAIYIEPGTGAHLSRRGGFIGWRKVVDHLRDGDYGIMFPPKALGLKLSRNSTEKGGGSRGVNERQGAASGVSKEVVGNSALLKLSLFGDGILRNLLPRVSPVKSTSAPLRF